jgi:polyphosphate kinase
MPRNFFRRIEVVFPIEDGNLRERIKTELLDFALGDNIKARLLQPDGSYVLPRQKRGVPERRSQTDFISLVSDDTRFFKRERKTRSKYPKVKMASGPFPT